MFVHLDVFLGFFVAPETTTSFESITLVSSFNTITHQHLKSSTYLSLYLNLMFIISSIFQEPFEMFPEGSGEVHGVGESEQKKKHLIVLLQVLLLTHLVNLL